MGNKKTTVKFVGMLVAAVGSMLVAAVDAKEAFDYKASKKEK